MRYLRLLPLLLTVAVIYALNHYWSEKLPALGRILDPVNGAMAAAEPVDKDISLDLKIAGLHAPVEVWMEDRLVPHIRAQNDHDLYLAQGYIHAYFRLWQMDFQTRFAAGRISEVVGAKAIELDRGQRRKGMVWAAERSLKAILAEPHTREMILAYTDGINDFTHGLNYRDWPLEYKIIGYAPEDWTPLKTSLMMKNMADDLTGKTDDIAYTVLRDKLGERDFDFLFPEKIKGSKPVIPEGTKFAPASLPVPKFPGDSVWAHWGAAPTTGTGGEFQRAIAIGEDIHAGIADSRAESGDSCACGGRFVARIGVSCTLPGSYRTRPGSSGTYNGISGDIGAGNAIAPATYAGSDIGLPPEPGGDGVGSNNWAISGAHTASGAPILCNDPHLGLTLPSLWFEMQLTAPGINSYGVSLPGAPGIVIGFNDSLSWGMTNNYRDVKDFYDIQPPLPPEGGALSNTYTFCGKGMPFELRVEQIKVNGHPDLLDTVRYTLHGPVMYDSSFLPPGFTRESTPFRGRGGLACTWMAHRGSNELQAVYLLNRAKDYTSFTEAISRFSCPAQNFAYADRAGNIAMWGQGQFVNKWKGQGKFVMEGRDSATLWGQDIPWQENPHVLNPPQGYVASANQSVTDSTYPYWYNGMFFEFRSWEINKILDRSKDLKSPPLSDVERMKTIQNDVSSILLQRVRHAVYSTLKELENPLHLERNTSASVKLEPFSPHATEIQIFWSQLYRHIWEKKFNHIQGIRFPSEERTVQIIESDTASNFYDDPSTPQQETLSILVQQAYKEAQDSIARLRPRGEAGWGDNPKFAKEMDRLTKWYWVKNTTVRHLARIPQFSFDHLEIGGWSNTINACTQDHGPSWRMIVEMGKDSVRGYGVYPGGQSGNPGSPHYADFLNDWVKGQYNTLKFVAAAITKNPFRYKWTLHS